MTDATPLLQLIHVSDLHVSNGHNDKAKVAQLERLASICSAGRSVAEFLKIWREGTAGHSPTSERAFDRYLQMLSTDKTWFPIDGSTTPATWLIDTGDASAFGDEASISYALAKHAHWCELLHNCASRCLFGNHDLWSEVFPLFSLFGEDLALRAAVKAVALQRRAPWKSAAWREPLTVSVPDGPCIEFYALDTNGRGITDEIMAVGEVDTRELDSLCAAIGDRTERPAYRILGTHHPLSFPYSWGRSSFPLLKSMVLDNATDVMRRLRNDDRADYRLGGRPYVNLFLSGHTHLGFPGEALPDDVAKCHQQYMAREQLQLVTGALMQATVADQLGTDAGFSQRNGEAVGYSHSKLLEASSQFQVLRFYHRESNPGELEMHRQVWAYTPFVRKGFMHLDSLDSVTIVRY